MQGSMCSRHRLQHRNPAPQLLPQQARTSTYCVPGTALALRTRDKDTAHVCVCFHIKIPRLLCSLPSSPAEAAAQSPPSEQPGLSDGFSLPPPSGGGGCEVCCASAGGERAGAGKMALALRSAPAAKSRGAPVRPSSPPGGGARCSPPLADSTFLDPAAYNYGGQSASGKVCSTRYI